MKLQGIINSRQDAEHYDYIVLLSKYTKTIINQIFHRSFSNILNILYSTIPSTDFHVE